MAEVLAAIARQSGWAVLLTVATWPRDEDRPPTVRLVRALVEHVPGGGAQPSGHQCRAVPFTGRAGER